jgi:hypothetical protein
VQIILVFGQLVSRCRRHGATVADVRTEDTKLHLVAVPEWILCVIRVEIRGHHCLPLFHPTQMTQFHSINMLALAREEQACHDQNEQQYGIVGQHGSAFAR